MTAAYERIARERGDGIRARAAVDAVRGAGEAQADRIARAIVREFGTEAGTVFAARILLAVCNEGRKAG